MNQSEPESVEKVQPVEDDESSWVEKARAGDQEAWAELHGRYYAKMKATVCHICGDESLAEDVVQESFIKAFRQMENFRGGSKFSTWLYRIAVNQALDAVRKRSRMHFWLGWLPLSGQDEDEDAPPLQVAAPEGNLSEAELSDHRAAIGRALTSLDPEHRAVVELRLVQGFSTDETAKILKCKRGTVLSRLYYSCRKLQRLLKKNYEEL